MSDRQGMATPELDDEVDAYFEAIGAEWEEITGRVISPADYRVMMDLRAEGVPLDLALSELREQVSKRGRSKPLAYHRPAILEAWRMQRELMAPGAGRVESEEEGGGWGDLATAVHATIDHMVGIGKIGGEAAHLLTKLAYDGPLTEVKEEDLPEAWAEWKRQAAEIAVREGVEPGVVGEIIRRVEG